ncbi:MAG: M28 family peptidase [Candidatus Zixiibacteriota bacterium]
MRPALACSLIIGLFCLACVGDQTMPVFDQNRAMGDLRKQVEFGPRVPGSEGHAACLQWLQDELSQYADSVWTQPFSRFVPLVGDSMHMVNIIAHFNSGDGKRILLGAHWDTRAYADQDPNPANWQTPVDGANDAASGVAVLLELARAFADQPPPLGVDIVLFDGEDQGRYSRADAEWALGSQAFVFETYPDYEWGVLVDMVGERNPEFRREGYSYRHARELQDRIWTIAASLGRTEFLEELEDPIHDDHVAFLMSGIPMVDIIDLRYPYWHTIDDTVDKCAPESLGSVGRVLMHLIYSN